MAWAARPYRRHSEGNPSYRSWSRSRGKWAEPKPRDSRRDSRTRATDSRLTRATDSRRRSRSRTQRRSDSRESCSSDSTGDDEIVHFDWRADEYLGDKKKYLQTRLMGDGTFGRCLECRYADPTLGRDPIAVKVIRDVPRYVDNAKIEVDVLDALRRECRGENTYCVALLETFFHRQFYCLSFEPLSISLYDLVKKNKYRGMWVEDIQVAGSQTASALEFCERLRLTHTDLKPENILFSYAGLDRSYFPRGTGNEAPYWRPRRPDIKVIDFGNATFSNDHHAKIINTRQYRGPEVILDLGWDESSDLWSLGCILMELYGGDLFFPTHDDQEHLCLMEKTLGPLGSKYLSRTSQPVRAKYMTDRLELRMPVATRTIDRQPRLEQHVIKEHRSLTDLVGDLLQYDTRSRPKPADTLRYPFFRQRLPEF